MPLGIAVDRWAGCRLRLHARVRFSLAVISASSDPKRSEGCEVRSSSCCQAAASMLPASWRTTFEQCFSPCFDLWFDYAVAGRNLSWSQLSCDLHQPPGLLPFDPLELRRQLDLRQQS